MAGTARVFRALINCLETPRQVVGGRDLRPAADQVSADADAASELDRVGAVDSSPPPCSSPAVAEISVPRVVWARIYDSGLDLQVYGCSCRSCREVVLADGSVVDRPAPNLVAGQVDHVWGWVLA